MTSPFFAGLLFNVNILVNSETSADQLLSVKNTSSFSLPLFPNTYPSAFEVFLNYFAILFKPFTCFYLKYFICSSLALGLRKKSKLTV